MTRDNILLALRAFVAQRPGLEYGNYGDWPNYRSEMRRITKQRHDAETLLSYVERSGMSTETLLSGFRAFSGRLTWTPVTYTAETCPGRPCADGCDHVGSGGRLDYCTGQYFPTEYRSAACAVLVSALWNYWRDDFHAIHGTYEGAREAIQKNARLAFRRRSIRERFS